MPWMVPGLAVLHLNYLWYVYPSDFIKWWSSQRFAITGFPKQLLSFMLQCFYHPSFVWCKDTHYKFVEQLMEVKIIAAHKKTHLNTKYSFRDVYAHLGTKKPEPQNCDSGFWGHFVVRTGIEPVFHPWKGYVLTPRRTDQFKMSRLIN